MKKRQNIRMAIVACAFMVFGSHVTGMAEEGRSVEQMIAEAKTAAEYEAIAVYYEQQAQRARQAQRQYESARAWAVKHRKAGPVKRTGSIAFHTASIARAEQRAKEYESLTEQYRSKARALR